MPDNTSITNNLVDKEIALFNTLYSVEKHKSDNDKELRLSEIGWLK